MRNRFTRASLLPSPALMATVAALCCLLSMAAHASAQARATRAASGQRQQPQPQPQQPPTKSMTGKLPVVREVDLAALRKLLQPGAARSRPLLVNFWATWCEPCREEFPDLVRIDEQYGSNSIDFITISLDDVADIKQGVPQYLQRLGAHMPAYLLNVPDPEEVINLVDPKWTGAMPATFLFDSHGALVFKHTGRIQPDELRAAIEKATKKGDE